MRQSQINHMPYDIGGTSAPFAAALQQDFAEAIESTSRVLSFDGLVTYKGQSFIEDKLLLADRNFFSFFSFPLAKGNPRFVFINSNRIVLSQRLARKYFGDDDAVGKIIRLDDQYDMLVTGIMDEFRGNSHLQFDAVGPMNIARRFSSYQSPFSFV